MPNVLEFLLLAKDEASDAFEKVGKSVEKTSGKLDGLKTGATIAAGIAGVAVAGFAKSSVDAFESAQQKQTLLEQAYQRFPNLADVNIESLRKYNQAIQAKTGYDDDDIASSQAVLAQYNLTGDQLEQLTPLVADYAAKTGDDLNTAAEKVGKAMLGQGRALKEVGINFKNTGSSAGNFQELMSGLQSQVGGTADALGDTTAGKAKILGTEFENLQETVGGMLVPVLDTLVQVGTAVVEWLQANPAVLNAVVIGVAVLTAGIVALAAALWLASLTPITIIIGLIVIGIAALVAAIVWLVENWSTVWQSIQDITGVVVNWIVGVFNGFMDWWNGSWTAVWQWIVSVWTNITTAVQTFITALALGLYTIGNGIAAWWNGLWSGIGNFVAGIWNGIVSAVSGAINWVASTIWNALQGIQSVWSSVWGGLTGIVRGVFNGVLGAVQGGINGAIDLINGMIGAVNSVGGFIGINIGTIGHVSLPHFADGGVAPGGLAVVGERGPELVNLPAGSQVTPNGGIATMRLHPDDIVALATEMYQQSMRSAVTVVRGAAGR